MLPFQTNRPVQEIPLVSGAEFRQKVEQLSGSPSAVESFRVEAALMNVDFAVHGPMFYKGCASKLDRDGRQVTCRKMVDAFGECPKCGTATADPVPVLRLQKGKFSASDGSAFRATAFGEIAEQLLDMDGARALELEDQSVRSGDGKRESTVAAVRARVGVKHVLVMRVENLSGIGEPARVSVTITKVLAGKAVPVEMASLGASEGKRPRTE